MNAELFYAIEFTISLGLFYLLYYFVLRKETFFRWNRFYIILAVLISLLVPFIKDYFIQKQLISPMAFIEEKVLRIFVGIKSLAPKKYFTKNLHNVNLRYIFAL